jgi:hypothetical protein
MNNGADSKLGASDLNDLRLLNELVWNNQLTEINGTYIKKYVSYHMKN